MEIVMYGLGNRGKRWYDMLEKNNMGDVISCFCDKNAKEIKEYKGKKVYTYEELRDNKDLYFIITPEKRDDIEQQLEIDNRKFPKLLSWQFKVLDRMPLGHFASTVPDLDEIERKKERIFRDITAKELEETGINLNKDVQLEMMKQLSPFIHTSFPFEKSTENRYYHNQSMMNNTDIMTLHAMLRHLKPKKVIEVGSGFTSAMMLDTSEIYLDYKPQFTFIDPFADRLKSLLKESDYNRVKLYEKPVQDVSIDIFKQLEAGDILFIDSSHVSKIGSDVNYELFEILPYLNKGVYIHFHDISWGFTYPKRWIFESMCHWNEVYLLRAFLMNNFNYEIVFWPGSIPHFSDSWKKYYNTVEDCCGGSIWIRKK